MRSVEMGIPVSSVASRSVSQSGSSLPTTGYDRSLEPAVGFEERSASVSQRKAESLSAMAGSYGDAPRMAAEEAYRSR